MENRFTLRPLKMRDAEKMLEWMHDENVTHFLRINGKNATIEDTRRFIENAKDEKITLHRAITDESGNYLGTVSLKNIDREKREAEYAICMHSDAMGTGAAKEGTRLILALAFSRMDLRRVYLNVLEENLRAVKFYNKFGFTYVGKSETEFKGQTKPLLWYEIISEKING